jgi:hypothetical protein
MLDVAVCLIDRPFHQVPASFMALIDCPVLDFAEIDDVALCFDRHVYLLSPAPTGID